MNDWELLVAADPGKMTGIAGVYADGTFFSLECGFDDTCRHMIEMATKYGDKLVIVAESFVIGPQTVKNTQAPWSLELIGVMRMISRLYTGRELHLTSPASAKRFSSDARLKKMGWHRPARGHANDAARHLLLTMVTRGWLPTDTVQMLASVVE